MKVKKKKKKRIRQSKRLIKSKLYRLFEIIVKCVAWIEKHPSTTALIVGLITLLSAIIGLIAALL